MLPLVVLGIFTLSGLPLSALGSNLLFRVDVRIPQEKGRNEMSDIVFINKTLNGLTDITVRYILKAFDNQHVLLVLEVEESCDWPSLTSAFTAKGYKLSTTALETCNDYAKEIEEDVTFPPWTSYTNFNVLRFYDVMFPYDQTRSGDDYLNKIRQHLENDNESQKKNITGDCYKSLAQMPFRFIYFAAFPADLEASLDSRIVSERKADLDYQWLQNIRKYKAKC